MLFLVRREPVVAPGVESEVGWPAALPLLGIGPLLFLQAMVFQNQGWIAQVAGLSPAAAFVLTMMGNLVLAAGVWTGLTRPYALRPLTAFLGIACLALSASVATKITPAFSFNVVIAQFVFGWSLAASRHGHRTADDRRHGAHLRQPEHRHARLPWTHVCVLRLARPAAARLARFAAAGGGGRLRPDRRRRHRPPARARPAAARLRRGFVAVAGVFLPAMVYSLVQPDPPAAVPPTGEPLRILTYNIHSAYDSAGAQDPEAIARVIESTEADIVALQEVSRGWVLDGSTDLVAWLARRLDMQVLFAGTTDPVWGNALLTRLPIRESGSAPLPLAGTHFPRGYLWATIDAGLPEPLLVIVTHLHHVESEHAPRLAQVPVLLDLWDGRPYSILLGDLNSEPGYAEMQLIADAGWVNSWAEAGTGDGLTWPAVDPFERIDWVWHTPDLRAVDAVVPATTASDHLPLFVSLEVGP